MFPDRNYHAITYLDFEVLIDPVAGEFWWV